MASTEKNIEVEVEVKGNEIEIEVEMETKQVEAAMKKVDDQMEGIEKDIDSISNGIQSAMNTITGGVQTALGDVGTIIADAFTITNMEECTAAAERFGEGLAGALFSIKFLCSSLCLINPAAIVSVRYIVQFFC